MWSFFSFHINVKLQLNRSRKKNKKNVATIKKRELTRGTKGLLLARKSPKACGCCILPAFFLSRASISLYLSRKALKCKEKKIKMNCLFWFAFCPYSSFEVFLCPKREQRVVRMRNRREARLISSRIWFVGQCGANVVYLPKKFQNSSK